MFFCLLILVQLITESLPVSSSGHVMMLENFFRAHHIPIFLSESWAYLLHGPTSLILTIFFRKRWFFLLRTFWKNRYLILRLILLGMCADIPTSIFYGVGRLYSPATPLYFGFAVTGLLLLSTYYCTRPITSITYTKSLIIGIFQGASLIIPGLSRMGATYAIGRWLGLHSRTSFLFSCMIQWPLITAGFVKGLVELNDNFSSVQNQFLCIIVASFLSYAALCFTYRMVLGQTIWKVGFYMIFPFIVACLM